MTRRIVATDASEFSAVLVGVRYVVYRRVIVAQKSANSRTSRGGLVWCGRRPDESGVKQNVAVTGKSPRADTSRSNQRAASGRVQSAQLSPVRRCETPNRFSQRTASS